MLSERNAIFAKKIIFSEKNNDMNKIITFIIVGLSLCLPFNCYANIARGFSGSCRWVIDDDGVLTISPSSGEKGTLEDWGKGVSPWFDYRDKIIHVKFEKEVCAKTCFSMFKICYNLETIDFGDFNTDDCVNMQYMFSGCESLKSLDISNLNTLNVRYMDYMFANCKSIESLDLSTFDVWNVVTMNNMFCDCVSLEKLDVSRWNTWKVAEVQSMFANCEKLSSLDLYSWDMREVLNMDAMFFNCVNLKNIEMRYFSLYRLGIVKNVFKNCHSLESLNLTGIYPDAGGDFEGFFTGCESLKKFYALDSDPFMWTIDEELFKTIEDPGKIILYVPREAVDLYKSAPGWSIFDVRAVEDEPKEISDNTGGNGSGTSSSDNPSTGNCNFTVANTERSVIHSLEGKRLSVPKRGINIVNGKKYLIK